MDFTFSFRGHMGVIYFMFQLKMQLTKHETLVSLHVLLDLGQTTKRMLTCSLVS
jgi:hypothetical protein